MEDAIAAIEPCANGECGRFWVHLTAAAHGGSVAVSGMSDEELSSALERAGLLPRRTPPPIAEMFLPEELEELRSAFGDGYRFAGKDSNGQVYAYQEHPWKRGPEWVAPRFDAPRTRRLHGEFAPLSFEDDEPLELGALFA